MNTFAYAVDRRRWLLLLLLSMAAFVFPRAAQAWWDCNWSARTPVLIAKPSITLTNYTLEVMLNAKDLPGYDWTRLDADIRVIDADDKTALTFFVQPRASGTQVVRLWVLFPTLPASKTIYIYYGNKTAVTASSGATTFATAATGVRVWTRQFGGTAFTSEAQSYAAWNAGNDSVAGYSCAVSKAFISTNNSGLFGSASNISWNITSVVYVSPAQAGTWGIRWGPDLGLGGALFIDDVAAEIAWGSDLWWSGSWTDATQVLQGMITLTAGYHVIRAIGNEGCCDGPQQIDLSAPGGKWVNLATGNYVINAPSCQLALATPQTSQTQSSTATCGAVHFQISNAATGLYCLNQAVTVTVLDASNNPVTSYSGTMTLSTTTAKGTWTLSSGSGTFADPVADDGAATYQWPGNSATVTFALSYRSGTNPVTVHAVDQSNATLLDDGTQSAMTFSPSGFTVTSSPFTNPAGGVPAFASPQTAGNNVSVYLTAYGQNPTDATCGIITSYTGAKSLKFWSTYVNPATGTRTASINATTIATTEAGAAAQSVTFTTGQATVTALYKDAGSMILSMKDDTTGNPSLPTGIRGSTGTFVWKPANFVVSGIKRTSDSFANPAASTASGTVFIGAGQAFTATVTAVESGGTATPNFGRESPAESMKFDVSLVLPASGNAPSVSGTAGTFTNGVATGTSFSWAEVGIVKLLPRVSDGNYLASGDVIGSVTGNVGRFIPDNFAVTLNTPLFGTGCTSSVGFTYIGQPFTYTVAPVIAVTARALGGTTTQNYTGSLFRLTNASLTNRTYTPTPASPTLNLSALPAATADPAIVDLGAGKASLTFSAGTGISFARGAAVAAFNANIALSINVLDLDAVTAPNPVTFGSGSGISFNTSAEQRYGRLYMRNSVGSELLDLPLPLTVQYYSGGAQGFITNVADSCTAAPPLAFSGYQGNLVAGETCVRDSGSPGVSGVGCSAAAASGPRYLATALAGSFNLNLSAPGSGNNGALTVTATAPAWLQYLWNASSGVPSNPAAMGTFGLFPGPTQRIYQREVY